MGSELEDLADRLRALVAALPGWEEHVRAAQRRAADATNEIAAIGLQSPPEVMFEIRRAAEIASDSARQLRALAGDLPTMQAAVDHFLRRTIASSSSPSTDSSPHALPTHERD